MAQAAVSSAMSGTSRKYEMARSCRARVMAMYRSRRASASVRVCR